MAPWLEQLAQWDRWHVWHAFTQMSEYEPFIVERAEGCLLIDVQGHRYLDGVSSLWCNVHGHNHPRINAAISEQLHKVAHVTSLGASNPATIELARRLAELSPSGLEHVFFSSDGASAVEVALKTAFQFWRQIDPPQPQRSQYVALRAAYHGDTLGAVSVGDVPRFHEMFRPLLFPVLRAPTPDMYRLPPHVLPQDACAFYVEALENVLARHADQVAAVVLEPLVQAAAGIITQPAGYLHRLREVTRRYDVLLIADEVAVGMGRTGSLFACQQEDVAPDLLCLGKGLSGGYLPLAATLATTRIWNAFLGDYSESKTLFHGHTFSGNPLAAAAALASLQIFEEERVLQQLPAKIERLQQGLRRVAGLAHVGDVRQCGMIAGIELVRDVATREPFPWTEKRGALACRYARDQGVWLRPLGDVIVLYPPLCVTLDQLDQMIEAVVHGVTKATRRPQG